MNLLEETIDKLEENNLEIKDIKWIGVKEFKISLEQFEDLADKEYENGFGAPHVATDLLVVGDNWWLERHEYDGSEWWEFKKHPKEPELICKVQMVVSNRSMWDSLIEINS